MYKKYALVNNKQIIFPVWVGYRMILNLFEGLELTEIGICMTKGETIIWKQPLDREVWTKYQALLYRRKRYSDIEDKNKA